MLTKIKTFQDLLRWRLSAEQIILIRMFQNEKVYCLSSVKFDPFPKILSSRLGFNMLRIILAINV
jgi:hypothetical protein